MSCDIYHEASAQDVVLGVAQEFPFVEAVCTMSTVMMGGMKA